MTPRNGARLVLVAMAVLLGCSPGASQGAAGAPVARQVIDGRWEYQPGPGRIKSALALDLWQVGRDSVAGRVAQWMSGSMVLDVDRLGPISGRTDGAAVTLVIPQPAPSGLLRVEAQRQGDTLVVTGSFIDADSAQLAPGTRFVRTGVAVKT